MENEIKIGDYVRFINGITKINNENQLYLAQTGKMIGQVVKHSTNLIDLIEERRYS